MHFTDPTVSSSKSRKNFLPFISKTPLRWNCIPPIFALLTYASLTCYSLCKYYAFWANSYYIEIKQGYEFDSWVFCPHGQKLLYGVRKIWTELEQKRCFLERLPWVSFMKLPMGDAGESIYLTGRKKPLYLHKKINLEAAHGFSQIRVKLLW